MPCELTKEEFARCKKISSDTRKMVCEALKIIAEDEISVMTAYRDFYLQISFSELHPLMVFCMTRHLDGNISHMKKQTNEMNLMSVLGSHFVNEDVECYNYRAAHWLDTEMSKFRFFEILDRCADEAARGFRQLAS